MQIQLGLVLADLQGLTTHDPTTEQKTPQPQNRPKIPARHPNSPYGKGSKKYPENTPNIPEKYPKTTILVFLGVFRGVFEGAYFGESRVLYVGVNFCVSWAFLFCSCSRGYQFKAAMVSFTGIHEPNVGTMLGPGFCLSQCLKPCHSQGCCGPGTANLFSLNFR